MTFLGIILHENLSWKSHMLALFSKIRRNVGIIYKLKCYLNTNNLVNIYQALVTSHLRYCITTWNHGNKTLVQKLDNVCNKLKKYINKRKGRNKVNLMSINELYTLETGKFMHKFEHGHLPPIFNDFFCPNKKIYSIHTRKRNSYHIPYFSKSVSQQSIKYSGVKVWNTLPQELKTVKLKSSFASKLRQHLVQS